MSITRSYDREVDKDQEVRGSIPKLDKGILKPTKLSLSGKLPGLFMTWYWNNTTQRVWLSHSKSVGQRLHIL